MFKPKRLIIIILIVGFLFSCGPGVKVSDRDGEAMVALTSLLFLCQSLWRNNSPDVSCTFINIENYGVLEATGIKLNPDINLHISILDNKFSATASHMISEKVFVLDASGKILEKKEVG